MTFRKKLGKSVDRILANRKEIVHQALEAGYDGDYEYALDLLDEVIYLFDSALDTPNTKAEFWHLKARALSELGRYEEALKAVEKSKEFLKIFIKNSLKGIILPSDDEDYDMDFLNLTHSDILRNLKRYEEALKVILPEKPEGFIAGKLSKYLKEVPVEPDVAMMQAHLLSHLGKNTEALELIDVFLKEEPKDIEAWCDKSEILLEFEKYNEALEACEQGLEIDPDDGDLLGQKGLVLLDLEKPKEALSFLEQSIQSDPTDSISWYNRACALSILNKKEESLDALTVATGLASENIISMKDDKDLDNIRDAERFKRLANQEI
ncbi:MAG: tetratricopeptide repeat protein [Candidatus Nitrosopelagicus sp.]|jgi:tetratricopeptide (TPR) repeat protein|nr:tetratricopeptide repeat protein [Candidatus Nitrosopelagicus sp.]